MLFFPAAKCSDKRDLLPLGTVRINVFQKLVVEDFVS